MHRCMYILLMVATTFSDPPELSTYLLFVIFVTGAFSSFTRWIERVYSVPPSNWRRRVVYPPLWVHVIVAYDMLSTVWAPESTPDIVIVYYAFTLFTVLIHSALTSLVYNWVLREPFNAERALFRAS